MMETTLHDIVSHIDDSKNILSSIFLWCQLETNIDILNKNLEDLWNPEFFKLFVKSTQACDEQLTTTEK